MTRRSIVKKAINVSPLRVPRTRGGCGQLIAVIVGRIITNGKASFGPQMDIILLSTVVTKPRVGVKGIGEYQFLGEV